MFAPPTLLRKAEGTQSKGRVVLSGLVEQRGQQHTHYKGRDTPKDTPARLPTLRVATTTRHANVLDDLAIKVVLGLDNAAKEHPAVYAGVGALEAGVVSLYGVVLLLGGWVRVGCARLCGVHEAPPRGPGSGVCDHLRGHFLCLTP